MVRNRDPLISIVVLNYNGKEHLDDCLKSLKALKYPNFEVIVVDNGSTDGSVNFVRKFFKWVRIVENEENLGFCEGNNRGYKASKGKYVVLLNNDTVVEPEWLSEMMKIIEKNESIGACACKVKLFSERNLFNSAGIELDVYGFAFSRGLPCRNNYEQDKGQYDKIEEVFSSYGAAMMVRKSAIKRVGFLNPDFKMWFEEIDFCWRLRLAGYKIFYVPTAIVYHKLFSTQKTSVFSKKQKFFLERNRLRTLLQNYGAWMLARVLPFYTVLKISEVLMYLIFRKFDDASATISGIFSTILSLPKIIKVRTHVQRKIRKVPDREIVKYMKKNSMELSRFLKGYGKFLLED
jgi:GT2 family glycosyltransferase